MTLLWVVLLVTLIALSILPWECLLAQGIARVIAKGIERFFLKRWDDSD